MASLWVVSRGNDRFEAPNVATLRAWACAGNLRPEDQIWNPSTAEWMMAGNSPEIASAFGRRPVSMASSSPASAGMRAAGYLIDVLPGTLIGLIAIVPIIGQIVAGLFLGTYWLLRDVTGASLGKLLLGMRVVSRDGEQAQSGQRIVRNVPIALGCFLLAIPIIGYFIATPVVTIMVSVEMILVVLRAAGSAIGGQEQWSWLRIGADREWTMACFEDNLSGCACNWVDLGRWRSRSHHCCRRGRSSWWQRFDDRQRKFRPNDAWPARWRDGRHPTRFAYSLLNILGALFSFAFAEAIELAIAIEANTRPERLVSSENNAPLSEPAALGVGI